MIMTQIEPPSTANGSPVPQTVNDEVFSRATHDLVMEQINPPIQHTAIAWAIMELVREWFAKIGLQIGSSPNAALKLMEYRNDKIRQALWWAEAANDTSIHQSAANEQSVNRKAA